MTDPLETYPAACGFEVRHVVAEDGTRLRVLVAGARNRRRVLCLHGFPQNAAAWRKTAALLEDDVQVIMPDLRGFGSSDISASGRYDLDTLAADVARTIESTAGGGAERQVVLVSHDWGGPIAWHVVAQYPHLLRHHVCVNGPHFGSYVRELLTDRDQRAGGWYTLLFQVPGVEHLLAAGGAKSLADVLRATSRPGTFTDEDVALYIGPLAHPARMRAALSYYRAGLAGVAAGRHGGARPLVDVPTTIVWGELDQAVRPSVLERMLREVCPHARVRRLRDATHWLPDESPEEVAAAVRAAWATAG